MPEQMDRPASFTVAIIGGGPAGVLTAIHVLRAARPGRATPRAKYCRIDLVLIEPDSHLGDGVAFATRDPRHLLNVRASGLSALPKVEAHFLDWVQANIEPEARPNDFLPRWTLGAYLRATLRRESRQVPGVRVVHRRQLVRTVTPVTDGVLLRLGDGSQLRADHVVLATGVPASSAAWAPPSLRADNRFVADPWAPGALGSVPERGDVLIVGSGLTAVDVALSLAGPGRVLQIVSRRGRLPRSHRVIPTPPLVPTGLSAAFDQRSTVDQLHRRVDRHVMDSIRSCGDWRAACDGLRGLSTAAWRSLGEQGQAQALSDHVWAWHYLRHRMAPASARQIGRMRVAGAIRITASTVVDSRADGDCLAVTLADGSVRRVRSVVSCTGPEQDVRHAVNPVVRGLLAAGWAVAGPHGLGLRTDQGRLVARSQEAAPIWTLGAMRRGELWESTAIPEIRAQAARLAGQLVLGR